MTVTPAAWPAAFEVFLQRSTMPVSAGTRSILYGTAATRMLRSLGFATPVLAVSANGSDSDREECLAAGCNAYLTKPVHRETLISLCRKWWHSA